MAIEGMVILMGFVYDMFMNVIFMGIDGLDWAMFLVALRLFDEFNCILVGLATPPVIDKQVLKSGNYGGNIIELASWKDNSILLGTTFLCVAWSRIKTHSI